MRERNWSVLMMVARSVAAAVLVLAVCSPAARAQPGMMGGGGWGQMFDASVSTRDLERYGDFLSLTPDQREAAGALLEGFQAEFDVLAKAMREVTDAAREEFRETRDMGVWEDMRPKMEQFQAKRKALEESFLSDVKLLLTEEQAVLWPRLERMRRRDTTMRRGLMSGESVDIVRLVEETKVEGEAAAALQPVLEQYEVELDRLLIERNELFEDGMSRGMALWRAGDMATIEELFNKGREASIKVRDANRRFARQVEGLLPEEMRADFASRFRESSFPRVYRPSYTERAVQMANGFGDLTAEQKETLAELKATYEREAAALNQKWAAAVEETELKISPMDMMRGGGSGEVREARRARIDLDERMLERLKGMLTEEQIKQLPDERNAEEDGREGGREGGRERRREGVRQRT